MKLLITKHSHTNPKKIYGNASEEVVLIEAKGEVLIVEHVTTKERFPVLQSEVSDDLTQPVNYEHKIIFNKVKPRVIKKAKVLPQIQSLFN